MKIENNDGATHTQTRDNIEKLVSALTRARDRTQKLNGGDTMKINACDSTTEGVKNVLYM